MKGNKRERWKQIPGFDYEVSDYGRVRKITGEVVNLHKTSRVSTRAYLTVNLRRGPNDWVHLLVANLVAEAFVGPRPPGKEVNHKDLNKQNNYWKNLEWLTHQENAKHWRQAARNEMMERAVAKTLLNPL